eukprot:73431-Prorocentrum_lima.AAC.1
MCWDYLEKTLRGFGFGGTFTHVTIGMIKSLSWTLLLNGHFSRTGTSSRSLPQGDCMSPLLFLLAHAGLFFLHARDNRIRGFPIQGKPRGLFQTAYVDDTTNVCTSTTDVHAIMENITTYSMASQQRCNVQKSTGLHIGRGSSPRLSLPNLPVTWVQPDGHHLLHNCPIGCTMDGRLAEHPTFLYDNTTHSGKLTGMLQAASRWAAVPRLSLRGRVLLTNQMLFSKVLYYCQGHPPNEYTTKIIQRIGSNFVWKQQGIITHTVPGWIDRDMSYMPWVQGGLGLHNMEWRLWSVYTKQILTAFIGVNAHPGCMLAQEAFATTYTHNNGTSWHLGAAILTCALTSYKGLSWYWA